MPGVTKKREPRSFMIIHLEPGDGPIKAFKTILAQDLEEMIQTRANGLPVQATRTDGRERPP
jgi:hypothetical protein